MQTSPRHRYRAHCERLLGVPFFDACNVEVLRNGDRTFAAMLDAIRQARTSIEFLTFVYWRGEIAHAFAAALADRAKSGVKVRVLLDAFGARTMPPELVPDMQAAGVDVMWFRPLNTWKLWKVDKRTHRKILVVDSQVAFTGGVGIAEEWVGDARNPSEWRDTHFRVTGPAVYGLQGAFFDNWPATNREMPLLIDDTTGQAPAGDMAVQVIRSVSSVGKNVIATVNHLLLALANERVCIATAYFSPDPSLTQALIDAFERGVKVDVMLPGRHADKRLSELAGAEELDRLLDAGVQLWRYQRSMLHAKILCVDSAIACIGSANFNMRSMRKDEEVVLLVDNQSVTTELEVQFAEDMAHCDRIERQAWQRRSVYRRVLERASRLLKTQA